MTNNIRRPLKTRGVGLFKVIAKYLSERKITPNQISIASVLFSFLSAYCFLAFSLKSNWWLMLLAAFFIQLRLLCNLFDGMVAIEGGKSTKSGELFNDIPDRIADPLILVAVGYSINVINFGAEIGWCAGLFAIMTAYIRTLCASIGAPINFQGPMAKQHRMAVLTIACLLACIEIYIWNSNYIMLLSLVLILFGSIITCIRRAVSAYVFLERS